MDVPTINGEKIHGWKKEKYEKVGNTPGASVSKLLSGDSGAFAHTLCDDALLLRK